MKRDMDLVREILVALEGQEFAESVPLKINGWTEEQIGYHCRMMREGGLIEGRDMAQWPIHHLPMVAPSFLTWDGHDFLDACRDKGTWEKAKSEIGKAGGGMTFDVIKAVLVGLILAKVKEALHMP